MYLGTDATRGVYPKDLAAERDETDDRPSPARRLELWDGSERPEREQAACFGCEGQGAIPACAVCGAEDRAPARSLPVATGDDALWPAGTEFEVWTVGDEWSRPILVCRTRACSAALAVEASTVPGDWRYRIEAHHPDLAAPLAFWAGAHRESAALLTLRVEQAARVAMAAD